MTARERIAALIADVERELVAEGYELIYRPYVEDSLTPGFPGMIEGRTDRVRQQIVVSTVAVRTAVSRLRVLRHELRHVREPEWSCGSRAIMAATFPGLYS